VASLKTMLISYIWELKTLTILELKPILHKQMVYVRDSIKPCKIPIIFRKKIYSFLEDLQVDVDQWLCSYNQTRLSQENIAVPMQTFFDSKYIAFKKILIALNKSLVVV
jgi:hypothetical protein